jgi:hypothetical protein
MRWAMNGTCGVLRGMVENAISADLRQQASGKRIRDLPITLDKLL